MSAKKIFFLAFAMFIAIIAYESCRPSQGCDGTNTIYYKITNPQITNYRTADTSHRGFLPLDTTKMTCKNFNWRINFDYETYCQNKQKNKNLPSLFSSAYALPASIEYASKEKIETFTVTTINNYDDAHLAGSSLNDIITITSWAPYGGAEALFVSSEHNLAEFMAFENRPVEGNSMQLYLTKPPKNNTTLKANIKIKLSNGQNFEINTTPVYLYK